MPQPGNRRGRTVRLAALSVAALTSVAMLTSTTSTAAPSLAKDKPAASKAHKQAKAEKAKDVELQILALNDFHGQLEASAGDIDDIPAGGAEYLATHLEQLRAEAADRGAHSVTVAAGDLVGATPLISAAFHDEPTIEAMNELGLDISSVGNHEFDEGWKELVRLQEGGCLADGADGANNQNSCPDEEDEFEGAEFQYLSANVFHEDTGETVFPGTKIEEYDGVKVGFIGMTLENTPNIVTKAGVEGLRFADEVETANAAVEALKEEGVKSIVVLLHEGGFTGAGYNECPEISGPVVDINAGLSPEIDAVITGHTHQAYNCALDDPEGNPRLITSASSRGRVLSEINLTINSRSGQVKREQSVAENMIVTQDVPRADALTALITKYGDLVEEIASEVLGTLEGDITAITEAEDDAGESPLGNLIADAQKADATLDPDGTKPVEIAFMNPGGIRADLVANDQGDVTYGAAFATQPFNNYDVAMDLTGDQILALLEQQWSGENSVDEPKVLQVSGITYSYSASAATNRVVRDSVKVDGAALVGDQVYRVTANSFLSDGGDGFGVFEEATNKFFGGLDIDALAAYLQANSPVAAPATDRITLIP